VNEYTGFEILNIKDLIYQINCSSNEGLTPVIQPGHQTVRKSRFAGRVGLKILF
jgi:hypothetical protein